MTDEEKQLQNDLSMIIDHFAALSEMDLPDGKISIHPLGMPLNLSEDIASTSLTETEEASHAMLHESKDGQFVVPPSLD